MGKKPTGTSAFPRQLTEAGMKVAILPWREPHGSGNTAKRERKTRSLWGRLAIVSIPLCASVLAVSKHLQTGLPMGHNTSYNLFRQHRFTEQLCAGGTCRLRCSFRMPGERLWSNARTKQQQRARVAGRYSCSRLPIPEVKRWSFRGIVHPACPPQAGAAG